MFYYYIGTIYQKIGDLFCLVHISGLSHIVKLYMKALFEFFDEMVNKRDFLMIINLYVSHISISWKGNLPPNWVAP